METKIKFLYKLQLDKLVEINEVNIDFFLFSN